MQNRIVVNKYSRPQGCVADLQYIYNQFRFRFRLYIKNFLPERLPQPGNKCPKLVIWTQMSNCAKFDPFMIESLSFDGITIIHSIFEEAQRAQYWMVRSTVCIGEGKQKLPKAILCKL